MGTAEADPAESAGQAPATSTCVCTKKLDECQSELAPRHHWPGESWATRCGRYHSLQSIYFDRPRPGLHTEVGVQTRLPLNMRVHEESPLGRPTCVFTKRRPGREKHKVTAKPNETGW